MLDEDEVSLEDCTSKISTEKKKSANNSNIKITWTYISANVGFPTTIALIFYRKKWLSISIGGKLDSEERRCTVDGPTRKPGNISINNRVIASPRTTSPKCSNLHKS